MFNFNNIYLIVTVLDSFHYDLSKYKLLKEIP